MVYLVIEEGGVGWGEDNYTIIHMIADNKELADKTAQEIQDMISAEEEDHLVKTVRVEQRQLNKKLYNE
jgi:hypothetical protein